MWFIAAAGIILGIIFLAFPEIDLEVSSIFYRSGEGFFLREHIIPVFIHEAVPVFTSILAICLVILLIVKCFYRVFLPILVPKHLIFLLFALIVGPGLVVNILFKENWGRARPVNIEQFGGEKRFTPPLVLSDQGEKSFTSGDASVGFFLSAFAFLFTGRRRKLVYAGGIAAGLALGLVRIMMGAHFLSDVLFSGVFVLLVIQLLHRVFSRQNTTIPSP